MKKILIICAIIACIISGYILYIGLKHNAMGEFCIDPSAQSCEIDYFYTLGIFTSWFLVIMVLLSIVSLIINWFYKRHAGL